MARRYVFRSNGSDVALAITDAVLKYNEAQLGQGSTVLKLCCGRPGAHQRSALLALPLRRRRHENGALTDAIAKQPQIKNIYLINQDYSFGRAVAAAAKKMLAEKRPTHQDRRR